MSFHSPHLLWLLVPLVLLFSWELMRHTALAATRWPKIARAWAGAFDVTLGSRHSTAETRPRIWLWFGLAACIVALARPQWGVIEEKVFDQSREVLIAVDLSRSMLAQDVKPSRLERSKLLITSLLDGLKGERVGLVLFSGTAFLQSPLSSDYEVLREFLPALKPDYLPEGGTNYKALLETAMQAFGTSAADRYLIVLSDGEANDEDWKNLIDPLKAKGIRVISLGIGTASGSFIPDGTGGFVKDERGAVVLSRLNSSTLQELAQVTSGAYSDASTWINLAGLLKQTVDAGKKGEFSQKNTARLIERYQWFLAPGLLLLLLSYWTEFPVRPRERALPLGAPRQPSAARGISGAKPSATVAAFAALFWFSTFGLPPSAQAAPPPAATTAAPAADPGAFAAPLAKTIERLAAQDALSAKDCSELAQTTVTYGQRAKGAQQQPVESAVRDALSAVDLGEKLDAKSADWPRLRSELEELLKKPEDQKKQDQQKQDQQQQQQNQQQQKQNQQEQNQQNQDQQNQQDQQQQPQQNQQQKQEQKQDAFGDMKDQPPQQKAEPAQQPPQKPQSGTQKVGGQKEKKEEANADPEMAIPLQKLEQVKDLDSPAKLQMLLNGQQQRPVKKGKDW